MTVCCKPADARQALDRWDWRQLTRGVNSFTDSGACSLTALYEQMEKDGILSVFFYDIPEPLPMSFVERFITEAEEGRVWLYCAFDPITEQPLAFVFVNNFIGKSAMCHFGVLKAGLPQKEDIAKAWLNFMFMQGRENLSCLIGLTPVVYRHAWRFACDVGFEKTAVIPDACFLIAKGKFVDGIVTIYKPSCANS